MMIKTLLAVMAFAAASTLQPASAQPAGRTGPVVAAAQAFLASLTPDQRSKVVYAFDDKAQRTRWSNFPTGVVPRGGISMKQLDASQREAAMRLMATVLSPMGLAKVEEIRQADDDFKVNGSRRGPPGGRGGPPPAGALPLPGSMPAAGSMHSGGSISTEESMPSAGVASGSGFAPPTGTSPGGGPATQTAGSGPARPRRAFSSDDLFGRDLYFISILGEPSTTRPWMLQFGGHHLALNITVGGDKGVLTPTLTGAQPAMFTKDGRVIRPLGRESDKALALLQSLDETQRRQAVLGYKVADLVLGPGQDDASIVPDGLKASAMTTAQRAMLMGVVAEWAGIMNDATAGGRTRQIEAELDDTWFAWSGPTDGKAGSNITAYYRIQGPHLVIEYAPQSDEPDNHVHTIYRDPTDDYGRSSIRQ